MTDSDDREEISVTLPAEFVERLEAQYPAALSETEAIRAALMEIVRKHESAVTVDEIRDAVHEAMRAGLAESPSHDGAPSDDE